MAFSANNWTGIGKLGRDAETSITKGGKSLTKFSIACDHSFKVGDEWKKETTWVPVLMWGQDKLAPYLTKGTAVYVDGRLSIRSYDDKDGNKKYSTEIVADTVVVPNVNANAAPASSGGYDGGQDEGDVPF